MYVKASKEKELGNKFMEYNTIEDVIVILLIITISASVLSGFFTKPDDPEDK